MTEKAAKAKGKSTRAGAHDDGKATRVGVASGGRDPGRRGGGREKAGGDGSIVENVPEVPTDSSVLARSMSQVATFGNLQGKERGPAPPMPVPIATFNI
jgi:hypothetical protein